MSPKKSHERVISESSDEPADAGQTDSPRAQVHRGHRSAAVAQMLRMPVATLRVWERRYGVSQPALTPSGHRLYSADDVRRLAVIKQLSDRGHAIGSLASLSMLELQQVANTHTDVLAASGVDASRAVAQAHESTLATAPRAWRVLVVGSALAARLKRPTLLRWLDRPVQLMEPCEDFTSANLALQEQEVDSALLYVPQLPEDWLQRLQAEAPALSAAPKAVLFRFASEKICAAVSSDGTALLQEPQNDTALGHWLNLVLRQAPAPKEPRGQQAARANGSAPPRRWDDDALVKFAGLSSTIACECPRHVAELLLQLSHFESYSAQCRHQNVPDAELHVFLQQVAATSRARFEDALERIALHEGLLLPRSSGASPGYPSVKRPAAERNSL
jgi:MerR family transcriptional regulator, light-induced transcriptional regulator